MVTHSMHQALNHGDRLLMLHEGRICLDVAGRPRGASRVERSSGRVPPPPRGEELDDDALLLG